MEIILRFGRARISRAEEATLRRLRDRYFVASD
jgi:hypothetical protein